MRIKNRQKLLTVVAVAAVAILAGDALVLSPLARAWKGRSDRIAELRQSVDNGHLLMDRAESIRSRWSNMQTHASVANGSAVDESEVVKAAFRWGQTSGISITSTTPQRKRTAEDYQTLECRVDAFGDIQKVARFLYELERDPLPLKIEEVVITPRDKTGQQLSLVLRFSRLLLIAQAP